MKIAIIGLGGREHALALALRSHELYTWPGSDALFEQAELLRAPSLRELPRTLAQVGIELCIIGAEQYLEGGLANRCRQHGIPTLGPSAQQARLETDKLWAKRFMIRHHIPTAPYAVLENTSRLRFPCVLKFNRLAGGKGVRICRHPAEARVFINTINVKKIFGEGQILVEDYLTGRELSVICLVAGGRYHMLPPARDYKPLLDGDRGPNTGGMGAVASRCLERSHLPEIEEQIIRPTVEALSHYRGFLYFGLMLGPEGPKVLEYNCRLGDPEAQVILPLLLGSPADYFLQAARGHLDPTAVRFASGWSLCVVAAAKNYPRGGTGGEVIQGFSRVGRDVTLYHAGTRRSGRNGWIAHGGRILGVATRAPSLAQARRRVYAAMEKIHFNGMQYRKDIGRLHF